MSDIQDPQLVLQRRIQQRQILAMMGINHWVQPSSETLNITDIAAPTVMPSMAQSVSTTSNINTQLYTEQPYTEQPVVSIVNPDEANVKISDSAASIANLATNRGTDHNVSDYPYNEAATDDLQDISAHTFNEQSPVTYSFDAISPDTTVGSKIDTVVQQAVAPFEEQAFSNDNHYDNTFKVAPFDLQGGRYGDWVVIADIQSLNNDSQKLWQNITQALSISCETTSFPICEGMDTAELANASFAGYVFKIGRSEEIKVATLTPLPEGLDHPNLTTAPTLDEMLTDSSLKRTLWEMISGAAD
ncbi:hypothetical protein Psyc_1035 [Psychrobacter arcticus 273-4]|uniref:Uncharacterized protein n=1 Tax=Psychrobacter arcticus (strain DSM 17307 / VKM B-2377 / 273-4) TaxID=259536 RepID=Q4FSX0_PSYA2|nr:hypothetical protein [Psychrobacter arcticus]AAZ18888.1 hypothetical protein Psyc_1035 [Psychrobacter arcticus 273-4]